MSFLAEQWAWEVVGEYELPSNARLLLLYIAFRSNDPDLEPVKGKFVCWPGAENMAYAISASEATVFEHLKTLEKRRLIKRHSQMKLNGRGRANDVIELKVRAATSEFAQVDTTQQPLIPPAATSESTVQQPPNPPDPSNKRTNKGTDKGTDTRVRSSADTRDLRRKLPDIDGEPVAESEFKLATQILDCFNALNGSNLSLLGTTHKPTPSMSRIVMRVREHPELDFEDYERIIKLNFEAPWWDGSAATAAVIFGPRAWPRAMGSTGVAAGERKVRRDIDRRGRTKGPAW